METNRNENQLLCCFYGMAFDSTTGKRLTQHREPITFTPDLDNLDMTAEESRKAFTGIVEKGLVLVLHEYQNMAVPNSVDIELTKTGKDYVEACLRSGGCICEVGN